MPARKKTPYGKVYRQLVEYDDKITQLELWRMNLVPPSVGIFDEPKRCYPLNDEWAKIVIGMVSWLAETPVWRDAENEGYSAIEEILKFMIGQPCMKFELRQSTENPCLLEQSVDGGVIWTTAFDYSLCVSPALASQSLNDSIGLLDSVNTAYNGTVTSVAPDMVYDSTATDDIRDLALCHALGELVDLMRQAEIEYRNQIALSSTVTSIMLAILAVVILVATAGTATPFYLAVSASLAGGFGLLFGALSDAILTDDIAKDAVVCCMRDALAGVTITQLTFEQSLDNCNFTAGTNESQLAGAISQLLTQDNMYISFLDYMQRAYQRAELGILYCSCACVTYNFLLIQNTFVPANLSGPYEPRSIYTVGVGFSANPAQLRGQVLTEKFFVGTVSSIRIKLDVNATEYASGSGTWWYRIDNQVSVSQAALNISEYTFSFPKQNVATRVTCGYIYHSIFGQQYPLAPQSVIEVELCE